MSLPREPPAHFNRMPGNTPLQHPQARNQQVTGAEAVMTMISTTQASGGCAVML